ALSSGSTLKRASASSPRRTAATTSSFTTRPSSRRVTSPSTRTRRLSSTSPRVRRARRRRTSARSDRANNRTKTVPEGFDHSVGALRQLGLDFGERRTVRPRERPGGAVSGDPLDVDLEDTELLAEVDLTTTLIAAANQSEGP